MKLITPKFKWLLSRILPFGLIWLIFGILYTIIERGLLGNSEVYPATKNPYVFEESFLLTTLGSLISGLIIGVVEVFYLEDKLEKYSFIVKLFLKSTIYLIAILLFLISLTIVSNSIILDLSPFDPEILSMLLIFFSNFAFWSIVIYLGMIIGITLYFAETRNSMGQNLFANFFLGKYHRPREERRIFMFLDMKSSTAIAETLGTLRYFDLLRKYFNLMTEAIIQTSGIIYQYAGDEIIITWEEQKGISNSNCLKCFYLIKKAFINECHNFKKKYGIMPHFKAGLHTGLVMTGEIGYIKKEIVYTGDVLNTAARIQGLCNEFNSELLISSSLFNKLSDKEFAYEELGLQRLKGKEMEINIYKVFKIS